MSKSVTLRENFDSLMDRLELMVQLALETQDHDMIAHASDLIEYTARHAEKLDQLMSDAENFK